MTLTEMREQLRNAQASYSEEFEKAKDLCACENATADEINAASAKLDDLKTRMDRLKELVDEEERRNTTMENNIPNNLTKEKAESLHDMLASREYARAFASAIRNGLNPRTARASEDHKILMDALAIGTNSGADGGFLVPDDIDHQIRELQRSMNALRDLVNVETVSTNSGWRVTDGGTFATMANVDEMGTISPTSQPSFAKVPYTLGKYADIVQISNELNDDEVAGLFTYLAHWFGKRVTNTENSLIVGAIDDVVGSDIAAGSELEGLKTALNLAIDPALLPGATILTNQSGFNVLDNLVDGNGRPLIHLDPISGAPKAFSNVPIYVASNAVLGNESTNTKAPVYIGNFKEYCTLFERNPLEMITTDVGGSAFRTDSIEVRGVKRMCVAKFDTAAIVHRTFAL